MRRFQISIAQLNPTVGDIAGNRAKAQEAWRVGRDAGSEFVVLPEMFLSGYQLQDLAMRPAFLADILDNLHALAAEVAEGPALGIGGPYADENGLFNAYWILQDGVVKHLILKHDLPNKAVFDEKRVFQSAPLQGPFSLNGIRIGLPICEDAWHAEVCDTLAETGAEMLIVPNGSPFYRDKFEARMNLMVARTVETGLPLVYLNMVGGQDDQVFDGGSFALNAGGAMAMSLPMFEEAIEHIEFLEEPDGWVIADGPKSLWPGGLEQEYRAIVEATRDYFGKTGFSSAVLGLSGGIDSAIVATVAADALGPENVLCVMLPSEYTSDASLEDAADVAGALGARLDTVPIGPARAAVTDTLAPIFDGLAADVTEENIQSRLRGLMLMALSNKLGHMLLTTGNKSEVAVGYATIYGDMAGGYNPIKDLYKTRVFELCRWRNTHHFNWMKGPAGVVIADRIIDKPPTAELRHDQKDEDSLPPYPVLDGILEMLIDQDASVAECVAAGYELATVKRVEHLIFISEYKRFQSAPGARVSKKAFWLDRRYPIQNRWRDGG